MVGRFGLTDITPVVGSTTAGEFPARAVIGEVVPIAATVFREGHDAVGATVKIRDAGGRKVSTLRMAPGAPGTDRWHADFVPDAQGAHTFSVEAWSDPMSTWHHAVTVKIDAGQGAADLANDLETGAQLFEQLARALPKAERARALAAATSLRDETLDVAHRVAPALEDHLQQLVLEYPVREFVTSSPRYPLWIDRRRALFGSWYEFFPRSVGAELAGDPQAPAKPARHGTLKDATAHLDYVADMGFDVVYVPPIHPIGVVNRKGPNSPDAPGGAVVAATWDVGTPWAVGSAEGGHDAVHPELGTLEDFVGFVGRARELGMEIALDLAFQCAPDHPWVTQHPEWFTTRPDGTIAYAENPPKKYQDIYPLNFDNDPAGLYAECLRVVRHWITAGVRIFRVDNPHTKPINFWQWLIGEVRKSDPDVLFLAEAFTRPAMMHELGKIGFHQSYTYYTWRTSKDEIEDYVEELASTIHLMRPNFFVNTPDILHAFLQYGGPGGFAIRAVLAATLSPTWGVYSGYELYEHLPVRPGSEEYLDSEKYQLRPRDFAAATADGRSLVPFITQLNAIRRAHPALQQLRDITFHGTSNPDVIAFSKHDAITDDVVLVVATVNPHEVREATVSLDLAALGLDWSEGFTVHDMLSDEDYRWGEHNYVRLDPYFRCAHVFTITR